MRPLLALVLVWSGCRDFDAQYRDCVARGRCEGEASGGGEGGGSAMAGGSAGGSSSAGGTAMAGGSAGGSRTDGGFFSGGVCGHGVCWESPLPFGYDLTDVAAVSDREAWFVGEGGAVVHLVDDHFEALVVAEPQLISVAVGAGRVLAVGGSTTWELAPSPPRSEPSGLQRVSAIHAAGDAGFVVAGTTTTGAVVSRVEDNLTLGAFNELDAGVITSLSGPEGRLVCVADDEVFVQAAADLSSWSRLPVPPGPHTVAAVDSTGRRWVSNGSRYLVEDAGGWVRFDAGRDSIIDLASGDGVMGLVTESQVLRCSAPGVCSAFNAPTAASATAFAGVSQFVAGASGAMARVEDGGLRLLNEAGADEVRGLVLNDDGSGWAGVLSPDFLGKVLERADGGWRVRWTVAMGQPLKAVRDVAMLDQKLVIATEQGIYHVVSGQLRASTMQGQDMPRLRIEKLREAEGGTLAVGQVGSVFRRRPASTTWDSLVPVPNGTCLWPALDAGVCDFKDVLPLPGGGFIAVGHDGNNRGLTLTWLPDGGVVTTHVGKVRQAIQDLGDGGVIICGWDNLLQVGSPTALVTQPVAANFAQGCNTLGSHGQQLVFTHEGQVGTLSFDGADWGVTQLTAVPGQFFWSSAHVGDTWWFGGNGRAIVRADRRDAGP